MAWWSDKKARDQRAKIEKTFKHGRFSREKHTLGLLLLMLMMLSLFYFHYGNCPCVRVSASP